MKNLKMNLNEKQGKKITLTNIYIYLYSVCLSRLSSVWLERPAVDFNGRYRQVPGSNPGGGTKP